MAKKITTLYINDSSIRLMVTKGKRIRKTAQAPLDMNLAGISDRIKEAELAAKIKHLFKANKVRSKKVIVGLSGRHSLSRPVFLPMLPQAMQEEAVIREAKRVLPVPVEQLYISWQILSASEGQMQGFMVAIPRQIADELIKVLRQIGLKLYLMDIKPLALARLIPETTAIIVDVQESEFDIVVMAGGIPQPVRTVPFPEEKLHPDERLAIVKDEIKRTVQFYNSNNQDKQIQPGVTVYVSGEADSPQLGTDLEEELGYKVLPLRSPLKNPKQLDTAGYLVNVGLALKELPKERGALLVNLNTLPVPYQPKQINARKVMIVPAAAVVVSLIFMLVTVIQAAAASIDSAYSQLDNANNILEQRQVQKKELQDSIANLEKDLAAAEAKRQAFTAALNGFENQAEVVNINLETVVDNVVSGLTLTNVSHTEKTVSVSGQAPTEVEVLEYARNLDGSGRFSQVTVSAIKKGAIEVKGEDGEEDYTIELVYFNLILYLKGAG